MKDFQKHFQQLQAFFCVCEIENIVPASKHVCLF